MYYELNKSDKLSTSLTSDDSEAAKEYTEELKKKFEPLTKWLSEEALKDMVRYS